MRELKRFWRRVGLCVCLLCIAPILSAEEMEDEPLADIAQLTVQVLELQRDLYLLDEQLNHQGDGIIIYLDVEDIPSNALQSAMLSIDSQPIVDHQYNKRERQALAAGGIQRLYIGPLAAGKYELSASFEGKIGRSERHAKVFRFEKESGVELLHLKLSYLAPLRASSLKLSIESGEK